MQNRTITFEDFDNFSRLNFAKKLTDVITKFYPFHEEAFVLSLNAPYGSGKTVFLEMWKHYLESQPVPYTVIYLNAWETDFDEDPLVPILSSILEKISKDSLSSKATSAFQAFIGATALTTNQVLRHFTGIDPDETGKRIEAEKTEQNVEEIGKKIYETFFFKEKAYEELKDSLLEAIDNVKAKPLAIFIDDLDRVRPDYAVKFLEAIKHIFPIQGLCFVIAVDKQQLEASVRQLYGEIDFKNYYLRFITREANLPEIYNLPMKPFLNNLAEEYFDEKRQKGVIYPFQKDEEQEIVDKMCWIVKVFSFSPRQIKYYFRVFCQLMAVSSEMKAHTAWTQVSLLIIAIFIKDENLYHAMGKEQATPETICQFVKKLNYSFETHNQYERRIIIPLLCFYLKADDTSHNHQVARAFLHYDKGQVKSEITTELLDQIVSKLSYNVDEYGHYNSKSYLSKLYDHFENWTNFLEPLTK